MVSTGVTHRTRYLIRSGGEDCVVTDHLAEALDHYRTLRAENIDDVQIVVETAQRIPLGPLALRLLLEANQSPTNPPACALATNP